jgi:hypothetical protein
MSTEITLTHADIADAVIDWVLKHKKDEIRGSGLLTTTFYATEYHEASRQARLAALVVHETYSAGRSSDAKGGAT